MDKFQKYNTSPPSHSKSDEDSSNVSSSSSEISYQESIFLGIKLLPMSPFLSDQRLSNPPTVSTYSAQKRQIRFFPPHCAKSKSFVILSVPVRRLAQMNSSSVISFELFGGIKNGDINSNLITSDILSWYKNFDDKEDTFEECS